MIETQNTQIKLRSGKVITLNDQQEEGLQKMHHWLHNEPEELFFCLSGYAGTGKTTIVQHLLPGLLINVAVTAPTHKAKRQIETTTHRKGSTIQQLLGLSPNVMLENFNINKPEFKQLKEPTIRDYKLIILDEASMLNKDLFQVLIDSAKQHKVKILFMCDEAQLPPVNEIISPVINSDLITRRHQLTHVERQAGDNPLMLMYDSIRNNLSAGSDPFEYTSKLDNGVGISFNRNLSVFGNQVVSTFASKEAEQDMLYCRVLCWTNERVAFWNKAIRSALYLHKTGNGTKVSPEEAKGWTLFMPGDLLMSYTQSVLENSGEYKVIAVEKRLEVVSYGAKNSLSIGVNCFILTLYDAVINCNYVVKVVNPEQEDERAFLVAFDYFIGEAKAIPRRDKYAWSNYFNFKQKYLLIRDIKDSFGKLIIRKDLDYGYALTVHKSQGSTYTKVFFDMADADKNRNNLERNKLKYVALSRPTTAAHVLVA